MTPTPLVWQMPRLACLSFLHEALSTYLLRLYRFTCHLFCWICHPRILKIGPTFDLHNARCDQSFPQVASSSKCCPESTVPTPSRFRAEVQKKGFWLQWVDLKIVFGREPKLEHPVRSFSVATARYVKWRYTCMTVEEIDGRFFACLGPNANIVFRFWYSMLFSVYQFVQDTFQSLLAYLYYKTVILVLCLKPAWRT